MFPVGSRRQHRLGFLARLRRYPVRARPSDLLSIRRLRARFRLNKLIWRYRSRHLGLSVDSLRDLMTCSEDLLEEEALAGEVHAYRAAFGSYLDDHPAASRDALVAMLLLGPDGIPSDLIYEVGELLPPDERVRLYERRGSALFGVERYCLLARAHMQMKDWDKAMEVCSSALPTLSRATDSSARQAVLKTLALAQAGGGLRTEAARTLEECMVGIHASGSRSEAEAVEACLRALDDGSFSMPSGFGESK